jgi:hypothetical protein
MTTDQKLLKRINDLITLGDRVIATEKRSSGSFSTSSVDHEIFTEFKNASLSFITNIYGNTHPYYQGFQQECNRSSPYDAKAGRGVLNSIRTEIQEGWLNSLRGILSAEIFVDFLEMAEHLLDEGYKDAAAVMVGSILEEHLRQLCVKNGIPTSDNKAGKIVPKRADSLNSDLARVPIYNLLDQKNVTAWLDLRNKAAHGKYGEYTKEQVALLLSSITDFMSRNQI